MIIVSFQMETELDVHS